MKVSKRQLRAIIKEEKTKLLSEQLHGSGRNQNVMEQLHTAIDALIGAMGNEEALMELTGIVDDWDPETYGAPTRGDAMTRDEESSSATSDMASKVWR